MQAIDWPRVAAVAAQSLPYVLAAFALVQSWAATSTARSAKKQARALADQLATIREQISIESEVAMKELNPHFSVTPVGQGELGVRTVSADNKPAFAPLDEGARLRPETWVWRRAIRLECTETAGQLIVSVEIDPPVVETLSDRPSIFLQGTAARIEMLIPHDVDHGNVQLRISCHLASNPSRLWTQRIPCFTGLH